MPTFAKLNLKDQTEIVVLNAPASFEPVGMVAIDEDWSALRFRRVEFIKTMNRPESVRLTKKKS
jgi:hypothetical protein